MPGDILSSSFRTTFEETLTPSQQQQAIDSLLDYIHEVQYGTEEQRLDLGVIEDDDVDAEVISRKLNATLEKCYWQLVMFLRSSKPSLIASAEPYLRFLLECPSVKSDPTHSLEILATLHLAAALAAPPPSRSYAPHAIGVITDSSSSLASFHAEHPPTTLGLASEHYTPAETRDAEAAALFSSAFTLYETMTRSRTSTPSPLSAPSSSPFDACESALGLDVPPRAPASPTITPASPTFAYSLPCGTSPRASLDSPRSHRLSGICGRRGRLPPKTELWARAAHAALLRRLPGAEHARDAARQLDAMRAYVREHPYALPQERYEACVRDLERDFGLALGVRVGAEHDDDDEPASTHLREADARWPRGCAGDSPPASPSCASFAPSCSWSSASSSSSASPQTPHTPLSPVNAFAARLHVHVGKAGEEREAPVAEAKHGAVEVEHREHVGAQ